MNVVTTDYQGYFRWQKYAWQDTYQQTFVDIMLCHLPANKGPPRVVCRCYTETTSSPPASYWRSGETTK